MEIGVRLPVTAWQRLIIAVLACGVAIPAPAAPTKHPPLTFTAFGELTGDGKQLPSASAETPLRYIFVSTQYRAAGDGPHETSLTAEGIQAMLQRSLLVRGYLASDEAHPAAVGLVCLWGPHAFENENASREQLLRNVLDRAALVGGDKFATDLAKAMRESAAYSDSAVAAPMGHGNQIANSVGAAVSMAQAAAIADPVLAFKRREPENEALLDQVSSNCYYVVLSAYDYKSLATPPRKLLWRTRATVSSQGVAQNQIFPTLISIAEPFFAVDTVKPKIIRMRANESLVDTPVAVSKTPPAMKAGKVEIGDSTLVSPPAEKPAAAK